MKTKWLALGVAGILALAGAAVAQQAAPAPGQGAGSNQGQGQSQSQGQSQHHGKMRGDSQDHHGKMKGYGMEMGGFMMGARYCDNKDPMAPKMIGRLESTIKPTDAQKPEMDALRAAATKAEGIMRAACPAAGDDDRSPPARLAQMEKSAIATADALKTIRPAFDALYAKLDDKQRDRMRWSRGHH